MRRFDDSEHANLLALAAPERLFVQRWVEMFDRSAILGLRCRPSSYATVDHELKSHGQSDFHVPIMQDERAILSPDLLSAFDFARIPFEPVSTAERLASITSGVGFHHAFLYHAYKIMVGTSLPSFIERLESLRDWWLANSARRLMTVIFVPSGTGQPPGTGVGASLLKWSALPADLRAHARATTAWWDRFGDHIEHDRYLWVAESMGSDFYGATTLAWEAYLDYSASSHAFKAKPIPLNISPALVRDPDEKPAGRSYAFSWQKYNFRLPPAYSAAFVHSIAKTSAKDRPLKNFWMAYAKALSDVRAGNPVDAIDDIAKGIDLAFAGYKPIATESGWGWPRLLVEKGAILLALDWFATRFGYLREYLSAPMFLLGGDSLMGRERRPERIFARVAESSGWDAVISRSDWDRLLQYSRDTQLQELRQLPQSLQYRHRVARWDLARAVRARNALFHRGETLQDQYLLAVLLQLFDLVIRLRLVAAEHGITWDRLAHLAEDDFSALCAGGAVGSWDLFVGFGWRRWRSKLGDDVPRA